MENSITIMKTCTTCNQELPLTEFHKRTYASGNTGYQNKCKNCTTKVRRSYYKPHEYMRRKFNLTDAEYQKLMLTDNCEICGVEIKQKKCIDHCHKNEKIRGVLCNNCNTALGLVGDNVETLSRMINYLNR